MPPKAEKIVVSLESQRDELVKAFGQLHVALANCAQLLETYGDTLSSIPASALDPGLLNNARQISSAALSALAASDAQPQVAGKKRKARADKGEKKERAKKDPLAPKRPASAYLLYQNQVRNEFVQKHKDTPYHDVLQKIASSWSSMSDEEKAPFINANLKMKQAYTQAKTDYDTGKAAAETAPVVDVDLRPKVEKPAAKANGGVKAAAVADFEEESDDEASVNKAIVREEEEEEDDDDDDDEDEEDVVKKRQKEDEDDEDEEDEEDEDEDEEDEPPKKKSKSGPTLVTPPTKAKAAPPPSTKFSKPSAAPSSKDQSEKKKKKLRE